MAVEDEFDVEIGDSDLDRLRTFDDLATYLTERLGSGIALSTSIMTRF